MTVTANSISIQGLYDARLLTGICSGEELSGLLLEAVGDPSPSGALATTRAALETTPLGAKFLALLDSPVVEFLPQVERYLLEL